VVKGESYSTKAPGSRLRLRHCLACGWPAHSNFWSQGGRFLIKRRPDLIRRNASDYGGFDNSVAGSARFSRAEAGLLEVRLKADTRYKLKTL
jgi:hypothetical protein